ncbi:hypothetical protein [Arcobacter roscoffensis]|uniref:Uncharacterized protein n=1 Tax=Arcobacter roscoffensis TaxID=2961520 RepID=A0ABY5E4S3_9BACT|nr:hypothetical protein [Arcobacter roscoffensis]UTJ07157.1 hypothetical protein NJU99_03450 [Arcobacter roscoffensis]
MEEQKKEELKELLKKSVNTDHFKEHKKDRNINNTRSEETKPKESSNTPKTENKKSFFTLQYAFLLIILVILFICIYLLNKQNKNIIELENQITTLSTKEIVKKEPIEVKIKEPIIKEKKVIEEKEIIKEIKIVDKNLTKEKFKEFYNSAKFNRLTCYDYKAGAIQPSKQCLDKIHNFLDKNKNALRFEIIPVVDKKDKELFDGIEKIKLENYSTPQRLNKYALRGLSRDRVLELTWNIRQIVGQELVLTPTNYFVESQKSNRGIIIKAYN